MDEKTIIKKLNEAYFSELPHERKVLRYLPKLLKETNLFLDVGASLGQFTKQASIYLKNSKIIAIEADPLRHRELKKNCETWSQKNNNNILAVHCAASDIKGTVTFQISNSSVSGGLFQHDLEQLVDSKKSEVCWTEVSVPAVTIDDIVNGELPGLIKMDIEGAEILALEGATKVLNAGKTNWLIELHDFVDTKGRKPTQVVPNMMDKLGYRTILLEDKYLFCKNPWALAPVLYIKTQIYLRLRKIKRAIFWR
jgi:FkbM family methyltransferase